MMLRPVLAGLSESKSATSGGRGGMEVGQDPQGFVAVVLAGLEVAVLAELVPADEGEDVGRGRERGADLLAQRLSTPARDDALAPEKGGVEAGRRGGEPQTPRPWTAAPMRASLSSYPGVA
jgi:hypothetical protein